MYVNTTMGLRFVVTVIDYQGNALANKQFKSALMVLLTTEPQMQTEPPVWHCDYLQVFITQQ